MAKGTHIGFILSAEEREALEKYCAENDLTLSQGVRKAIKLFLIAQKKKKEKN